MYWTNIPASACPPPEYCHMCCCDLFQNSCCLSLCICTGSGHDLGLIIGVSVGGGCAAVVAFVAVLSLSCWWRLWLKLRHKRNYCLLVDEDGSSYYGSASQSLTASVAYPNPSSSNEGLNIIQLLIHARQSCFHSKDNHCRVHMVVSCYCTVVLDTYVHPCKSLCSM